MFSESYTSRNYFDVLYFSIFIIGPSYHDIFMTILFHSEYQFEGLGFFHLQQYICLIKFSSNVTDFMIEYLRNFDFIFL